MKVLCPACSRERPLAIAISPVDRAAICPQCGRRYKVDTFVLDKQQSHREQSAIRYDLTALRKNGVRQPISLLLEKAVVLQTQDTYTLVSRSGVKLGLANQSDNTWITLFTTAKKWTFLNKLALFLVVPLVILALIQITRLPSFLVEQSLGSILLALVLLLPLLIAPAILWTLKETLQGEERSRIIPGYHPEDDDL